MTESRTRAWRLVDPAFVNTVFSGEGARLYGGRFNSKGRSVIYTSSSISLALLERLVRLGSRASLEGLICASVSFDNLCIEWLEESDLPLGWDARPYTSSSQRLGNQWLEEGRTAVLRVPSVVVPSESNFLINPNHPDFTQIDVGPSCPAPIDPRLHSVKKAR